MEPRNEDRLTSSPPPSYSSLFPEQINEINGASNNSPPSHICHLDQLHHEKNNPIRLHLSHNSNIANSQKFFVDEISKKKVIRNQEKVNLKQSSAVLDAIDVYPLDQFSENEIVARRGSTMLSREEDGTTFVGSQSSSSDKFLEYLLLPSISHKEVFNALRSWSVENGLYDWNWNDLRIDDILTSYLWQYKLGTICEWRRITDENKLTSENKNTFTSKWSVEIQRPEDLKQKTVNISNSALSVNCNCLTTKASSSMPCYSLCPKCKKISNGKPQLQIIAQWKKIYDCCFSDVISSNSERPPLKIPEEFLKFCHGKKGYENTSENGEVNPISSNDCLEEKMIEASRKLLKHHKSKAQGGKIVKQRHEIVSIPVYEVFCRQGRQRFSLCIVGTNQKLFLPLL